MIYFKKNGAIRPLSTPVRANQITRINNDFKMGVTNNLNDFDTKHTYGCGTYFHIILMVSL